MVDAFSEIEVSLMFRIGHYLKGVLRAVVRPIHINPCLHPDEGFSEGPAGKWPIVQPGKEIPGRDMMVEYVFESGAVRSWNVQLLERLVWVAAWTVR